MISRRELLIGLAASPMHCAGGAAQAGLRPEDFGAAGDGRTDDTAAFQALGRAVSEQGGGTIVLRANATYRLGRQVRSTDGSAAYLVQPMLRIQGVDRLSILGNGATLRLNDGLHYGSFDPASGARYDPPKGKFTNRRFAASIGALVEVRSSRNIRIEGLILDGNVDRLVIGGRWEVDIQLHADGLQLLDVSDVQVREMLSRNHGRDGIYVRGNGKAANSPADAISFDNVRCLRNGRQGMSIIGGAGFRLTGCTFSDTGQGPIDSAPGAGVDIEPNGRDWATDLVFDRCTFTNNIGAGLAAPQGASRGLTVRGCTFWQGFAAKPGVSRGSGDAFWLTREGVVFSDCRVHGTVSNLIASAQVRRSSFDDAVHPTYGRAAQKRRYLLSNAGGSFADCSFRVSGSSGQGLVYSTKALTLRRCRLHYAGSGLSSNFAAAFFGPAVTLEDVTFTEAMRNPSKAGHYIHADGPTLRGRVTVSGPNIRWGGKTGRTGNVAGSKTG